MRQLFTCPIKDTRPETIDSAMRQMWECATEMGFTACDEPMVKHSQNEGMFLDCVFSTGADVLLN